MIEGISKTEKLYRAINLDSSSSLKEFSIDRKKYYKKYILNENVEDKDSQAAIMGRLVETLLIEPEQFDKRFYMSVCLSAPTGLMLAFVEALYKHTMEATDDRGIVTMDFVDIAKNAYVDSGFKIKFDAVIAKFQGSDAEIYYNELREVRSKGLTVVTTQDIENADKIVTELKTNDITANIMNLVDSPRYSIFNQFQIEGYVIDDIKLKSMMDKVIVDHKEKSIQIYDLKCVWAVENFYEEYYLYRRAYIQAYLYYKAFSSIDNVFPFDIEDYEILCPKFVVCDSTNYFSPLIYTLSDADIEEAYLGFEHKNRLYPGVKEIIEDLKWAQEYNIWNISRKNHINNGIVNLRK